MKETIKKYKKKPVVVQAIKYTGKNIFDVISFIDGKAPNIKSNIAMQKWEEFENLVKRKGLSIRTLEGSMLVTQGDYIIKGIKGEYYPCKPDIFKKTYEIQS